MSRDQWPPLQRAVDALRARAEHGTVMPFGRRKAAAVLAELERRADELTLAVAELDDVREGAEGLVGDLAAESARVAAVRALADELDPPRCPEHSGRLLGKQPGCAPCGAWWSASSASRARGEQLRAVLDGHTEAVDPADAPPCGHWVPDPDGGIIRTPHFGCGPCHGGT